MESKNLSGEFAFVNQLTNAESPDSFENCFEENHVKMECESVDENDAKCSSPDLHRSHTSEQSSEEGTSNKHIISTDEQEPKKRRQKRRVLTREQKDRRNALSRAEALSEEQKEHRKALRRLRYKKNIPTPEQLERKSLRRKKWYWRKISKMEEQRKLEENLRRMKNENLSGEFALDNRLTNADTSNKCIVSTDEQEPQQPRPKKRVVTQEQKERYKANSRIEGLSNEQIEHKRAYAREKYWRRKRQLQEQSNLDEKSERIQALAKMRQEIKALKEELEPVSEIQERRRLQRKIYYLNKKEVLLETAINCALDRIPDLNKKPRIFTPEQRERGRLNAIQYRLKKKQKMMDSTSNTPLEIKSE